MKSRSREGSVELLGTSTSRIGRSPSGAHGGLGRSYQRTTIFPRFSVFENCRLGRAGNAPGALELVDGGGRLPGEYRAWRAKRWTGRASPASARTVHAGLLSHGEKRQLEIAMCIATQAARPAARRAACRHGRRGNGAHARRCLPALKAGHAILLVEHDMDAVFRVLGSHYCVMVNGAVIASDVPAAVRAGSRTCSWLTWAKFMSTERSIDFSSTLVDAHDVHVHYGESSPCCAAYRCRCAPAKAVGLLGRNGMGKTTLIRALMGRMRATRGRIAVRGQDATLTPPDRVARWGWPTCRSGRRQSSPNLSVRENLVVAARRGVVGPQRLGRSSASSRRFRGCGERLASGGQQLSGGEQQMLAIGRALSTNPDLADPGRGDRRLGAADRARDLADHRRHPRHRHRIADRRSQLPHRSRQHRSALILEKGRRSSRPLGCAARSQPEELATRLGV